jgi:hypothetical protein
LLSVPAAVSMRAGGWATARAVIPIDGLPPGAYVARADIDAAGAAGSVMRPFVIVR